MTNSGDGAKHEVTDDFTDSGATKVTVAGKQTILSKYNRQESHIHTVTVKNIVASGGWLAIGDGLTLTIQKLNFKLVSATVAGDDTHAQMTAPMIVVGDGGSCTLDTVTIAKSTDTGLTHKSVKCPVIDASAGTLSLTACTFQDFDLENPGSGSYKDKHSLLLINDVADKFEMSDSGRCTFKNITRASGSGSVIELGDLTTGTVVIQNAEFVNCGVTGANGGCIGISGVTSSVVGLTL